MSNAQISKGTQIPTANQWVFYDGCFLTGFFRFDEYEPVGLYQCKWHERQ
jgi:hypothetical protein